MKMKTILRIMNKKKTTQHSIPQSHKAVLLNHATREATSDERGGGGGGPLQERLDTIIIKHYRQIAVIEEVAIEDLFVAA